jgi:hypothetical protein
MDGDKAGKLVAFLFFSLSALFASLTFARLENRPQHVSDFPAALPADKFPDRIGVYGRLVGARSARAVFAGMTTAQRRVWTGSTTTHVTAP